VRPYAKEIIVAKARVQQLKVMPPCSRCAQQLLFAAHMPIGDGVDLELCQSCDRDSDNPAARELIEALEAADGPLSGRQLGELVMAWQREAMAARGWVYVPHPKPSLN